MRSSRICEWSEVSGPAGRGTLYHRLARDLPTALLAMTQHYFDLAIVSSQLREPEGWPLVWSSAFDVSTIVRLGSFARHRSDGLTGSNQAGRSRALRAADDESVPSQDERPNTGAVNNDFSPTIQILSGNSFRGTCLGFMGLRSVLA